MDYIFREPASTAYLALVMANAMFKRLPKDEKEAVFDDVVATLSKVEGDIAKSAKAHFLKSVVR